jgi:hypothetical protein
LEWRTKVVFEQIRREYEFGVGTIRSRQEVEHPSADGARGDWLRLARATEEGGAAAVETGGGTLVRKSDWRRTRRHRGSRDTQPIGSGSGSSVRCRRICERTVRGYVQGRKLALGLTVQETFVPQSYDWGVKAQVDWYDAYADLAGERTKLQGFSMRSMASGAAFHCALLHATQQAFLEGHERAFAYFTGVFRRLRYDNLGSAVKKILRGQRRGCPLHLYGRGASAAPAARFKRRYRKLLPPKCHERVPWARNVAPSDNRVTTSDVWSRFPGVFALRTERICNDLDPGEPN